MGCFLSSRTSKDLKFGCLHHTADDVIVGTVEKLREFAGKFDTWHSKKPWARQTMTDGRFGYKFLAYHFLIGDGVAIQVQDVKFSRFASSDCCAESKSANKFGVHFALVGHFEKRFPTQKELATLVFVLGTLELEMGLNLAITWHRRQGELCNSATACPGSKFVQWLEGDGRNQLVGWVNSFKQTGKLPFGFVGKKKGNEFLVEKEQDCEADEECKKEVVKLREMIKKLMEENTGLQTKLEAAQKEISRQGKVIDGLSAKVKALKVENENLRKLMPWCERLRVLALELLEALYNFLRTKIKILSKHGRNTQS